jgi:hypothetical protein
MVKAEQDRQAWHKQLLDKIRGQFEQRANFTIPAQSGEEHPPSTLAELAHGDICDVYETLYEMHETQRRMECANELSQKASKYVDSVVGLSLDKIWGTVAEEIVRRIAAADKNGSVQHFQLLMKAAHWAQTIDDLPEASRLLALADR